MNHTPLEPKDRIIVALDVNDINDVWNVVDKLCPYVGGFKIGLQLINRGGGERAVRHIHEWRGRVFWDGKFHDIPNTVAEASKAVADLGVWAFNIHCSGGIPMMQAAVENRREALVLGVTILTSLNQEAVERIYTDAGIRLDPKGTIPPYHTSIQRSATQDKVLQFAFDAEDAGLDGIICSPQELPLLSPLRNLLKVTPGVRPIWASTDDQARVMTPGEAVAAGADYLVIGRPILKPPTSIGSPVDAAKRIVEEIELAEVPKE